MFTKRNKKEVYICEAIKEKELERREGLETKYEIKNEINDWNENKKWNKNVFKKLRVAICMLLWPRVEKKVLVNACLPLLEPQVIFQQPLPWRRPKKDGIDSNLVCLLCPRGLSRCFCCLIVAHRCRMSLDHIFDSATQGSIWGNPRKRENKIFSGWRKKEKKNEEDEEEWRTSPKNWHPGSSARTA